LRKLKSGRRGFDIRPNVRLGSEAVGREVKSRIAGALGLAVLLAACGNRGLHSDQAVRQAIEAHLKTRSNLMMAKMTLEIESVKFSRDSAQADVKYRTKDNPNLAVSVHYVLRQAGDHWEVVSSSSTNGTPTSPHAAGAAAAPESPPIQPAPAPSH
jgi:hypothetical protein